MNVLNELIASYLTVLDIHSKLTQRPNKSAVCTVAFFMLDFMQHPAMRLCRKFALAVKPPHNESFMKNKNILN